MPGSFLNIFDPAVWTGAGGAILGLVGGQVNFRRGRLARLEREVEECRKRDARMVVVEAGIRLLVGEMKRERPQSQALRMFGDLLDRKLGPIEQKLDDFNDLLGELDLIPGTEGEAKCQDESTG